MHYYSFNIADYRKDTQHLTPMEHYIYRELIDWYYLDEKPIPRETQRVIRRLRLVSENNPSVLNVLEEYFEDTEKGWVHHKIERDIAYYKHKANTARVNGSKGGRPKKTQSVNLANPEITGLKANHKPITNNHNKKNIKKKTSIPDNFAVSDRVKKWASEKGFTNLEDHLENFKLASASKDYKYVDWDSAFMNAIRNNWAKINNTHDSGPRARFPQ